MIKVDEVKTIKYNREFPQLSALTKIVAGEKYDKEKLYWNIINYYLDEYNLMKNDFKKYGKIHLRELAYKKTIDYLNLLNGTYELKMLDKHK